MLYLTLQYLSFIKKLISLILEIAISDILAPLSCQEVNLSANSETVVLIDVLN